MWLQNLALVLALFHQNGTKIPHLKNQTGLETLWVMGGYLSVVNSSGSKGEVKLLPFSMKALECNKHDGWIRPARYSAAVLCWVCGDPALYMLLTHDPNVTQTCISGGISILFFTSSLLWSAFWKVSFNLWVFRYFIQQFKSFGAICFTFGWAVVCYKDWEICVITVHFFLLHSYKQRHIILLYAYGYNE